MVFVIDTWAETVATLGPSRSDELLEKIGKAFSDQARQADSIAHLSPGRFAALMPETDAESGVMLAVRLGKLLPELGSDPGFSTSRG